MWKKLFFAIVVRPIILLVSGIHLQGKEHLPKNKAAIIVANHNSHLDTMVIMSLFSLGQLPKVRPIAAADYFLKNKIVAWFSLNVIGIIPLKRKVTKSKAHPFHEVHQALENAEVVILFPEGSRGEAEEMKPFKTGIAHLAEKFPEVPVVPIFIHGAGKSLPKGEALFVPFVIDVVVGEEVYFGEEEGLRNFTDRLEGIVEGLEL